MYKHNITSDGRRGEEGEKKENKNEEETEIRKVSNGRKEDTWEEEKEIQGRCNESKKYKRQKEMKSSVRVWSLDMEGM